MTPWLHTSCAGMTTSPISGCGQGQCQVHLLNEVSTELYARCGQRLIGLYQLPRHAPPACRGSRPWSDEFGNEKLIR